MIFLSILFRLGWWARQGGQAGCTIFGHFGVLAARLGGYEKLVCIEQPKKFILSS